MIFLALISVAFGECADSPKAASLNQRSLVIETGARRAAGDPCPDRGARSTPAAEGELLEEIRDRTLPKLAAMARTQRAANASTLMTQFGRLRLAMARRGADVIFAKGRFEIVPAVSFAHLPGFAKLDRLTPEENERLQATHADRLAAANARLGGALARARVTEIGNQIRDEVRTSGDAEYRALIAAEPSLLFVGPDRDVFAAREAYVKALNEEARALPRLSVRPPTGEALALIYYAQTVADVLRARPDLCGAFLGLKARADAAGEVYRVAKVASDLTTNGLCVAVGRIKGAGVAGGLAGLAGIAVCTAIGVFDTSEQMDAARYRERRLLYGDLSSPNRLARSN